MRIDRRPDGTHRTTARCRWFMASARHRCFSLLMAKDWFTSRIPTSRYDTAGTFDKNHPVCHSRLLRLSTKSQAGVTKCSAYAKTSEKNYTHWKSNTLKLSNQNAEKSLSIATFNVHIFNQSTLQNTESDN